MDLADRLRETVADRYAVEGELGRGGMAVVFLARDLRYDRRVAIKVLRPELTVSLVADRFLREIQIAAQLQHPLIVPLYDSGGTDDVLWYVMPFIEGETLRQRLQREKQLPLEDALQITRDAAAALQCAHEHGFVHRDIKPENILLSGGHAVIADFGIARAITQAAGQGTSSGVAIGTPAYMSPEQASGSPDIDARTDIYSLGCVLYEMLAGEPPFTGPTPQAVIAKHVSERPPTVRVVRSSVPETVEAALQRALAKAPADRFPTATAMVAALTAAGTGPGRWPSATIVGIGIGVAVLAGGFAALNDLLRPARLDVSRYVIVPFESRPGAAPRLLDGNQCQWRLAEAFRRWDGIAVTDNFQLRDAERRQGVEPLAHGDWLRIARTLGAGRLVQGEVAQFGDTAFLTASVFDVANGGRVVQQASVPVPQNATDIVPRFERLAASLLGLQPPEGDVKAFTTRSLDAGRAFVEGRNALASGDLSPAAGRFLEATQLDPQFADAQFWEAQVLVWQGKRPEEWRPFIERAGDQRQRLADPRARALVTPLYQLAQERYAAACGAFRRLIERDSTDFAAWFGLGECQFRDLEVVADPRSPSGWRFRSSYHAAALAYRRALSLAPWFTGAFFERLYRLLFVEPNLARVGIGPAPALASFRAYPSLTGDTIAFVPYPAEDVRAGRPGTLPATHRNALARNRAMLGELSAGWAAAYPNSPDALAAAALVLEHLARFSLADDDLERGLRQLRRARRVAQDPALLFRLAHAEARFQTKLGRFEMARDLADSLLDAVPDPAPSQAGALAGLAALVGRAHDAARLLAAEADSLRLFRAFMDASPQSLRLRERYRAYASVGGPVDSLRVLPQRVDSVLSAERGSGAATALRYALLADPAALAFPAAGPGPVHQGDGPNDVVRMQAWLVQGNVAAVRSRLDTLRQMRRDVRVQDIAVSRLYEEAWLAAQIGDTARAQELLDGGMEATSGLSARVLSDPMESGSLLRAMLLRAEIAGRTGDKARARRWGQAVLVFWRDADPELQPTVERARRLIESTR